MSAPPPSYEHPGSPPRRPELPEGVWRPEPPPEPARAAGLPRWPLWAPFAAMLATLFIAVVGVGVIALLAELTGLSADGNSPGVTIGGTFVQDVALIGSAVVLARMLDSPVTPGKFGLRLPRLRPAIGWTLVAWAAFFAFTIVWSQALGITDNDDLPQELGADDSNLALAFVAVLVCVVAPIAEELFFRGFCFTALRRTLGMLPAAAATGIIFGAIHLGGTKAEFVVPLMVFGFLLCLLYVWTDSIVPCIALHALNNSLALGVTQSWGIWTLFAMIASVTAVLAVTLPLGRRAQAVLA
jgi:membrane protease YdiL (CAAX protease family)